MNAQFTFNTVWITNLTMIADLFCILLFAYLDIKQIQANKESNQFKKINLLVPLIFLMYLIAVFYGTIAGRHELSMRKIVLDPLTSYRAILNGHRSVLYDTVLNILFFIPFGLFLFYFFHVRMKWYHAFFISALFSTLIETTQYITKLGYCQTADILTNALGGLIGFTIALLLHIGIQNKESEN